MEGYIGIHVGNGVCVEPSSIWEDGIQCTFIKRSGVMEKLERSVWLQYCSKESESVVVMYIAILKPIDGKDISEFVGEEFNCNIYLKYVHIKNHITDILLFVKIEYICRYKDSLVRLD